MYGILRFKKIKTVAMIAQLSRHLRRTQYTPNANPRLKSLNKVLVGTECPLQGFQHKMQSLGIDKFRKNGVLLIEILLTFSHEYMFDDDGRRSAAKINAWLTASKVWLKENFDAQIISVHLHMDEKTPHAHALIAPIQSKVDKNGQIKHSLNARAITGGAAKLIAFQNSYADAVKHLGLRRGESGSKATHTSISDYYRALNAGSKIAQEIGINTPPNEPKKFAGWMQTLDKVRDALDAAASKYDERLLTQIATTCSDLTEQVDYKDYMRISQPTKRL